MEISNQLKIALTELFSTSEIKEGQILVVGCSTSEVLGEKIGTAGNVSPAKIIFDTIYEFTKDKGIFLACQCCEHLNRALVVEMECAEKYSLCKVCAVPHEKAGGSFATCAYKGFEKPVLVEEISADYGIDIGNTLIGMHLKRVAVPVRTSVKSIGKACVTFARTRPKYIGGARAKYE